MNISEFNLFPSPTSVQYDYKVSQYGVLLGLSRWPKGQFGRRRLQLCILNVFCLSTYVFAYVTEIKSTYLLEVFWVHFLTHFIVVVIPYLVNSTHCNGSNALGGQEITARMPPPLMQLFPTVHSTYIAFYCNAHCTIHWGALSIECLCSGGGAPTMLSWGFNVTSAVVVVAIWPVSFPRS